MNLLVVGTDKSPILEQLPSNFLLIDDEIEIEIPKRRKVIRFDVAKHSFNPLKGIDYPRARNFVDVINSVFPEGENTLTRRSASFALLEALLDKPKTLDQLFRASKDVGLIDARQKIDTLLLSPVLNRVLTRPTNFSFDGIILARLNRAELGDFDCFVLANLLISQYEGVVVIPDFGFYGCPFHTQLIRQNRLIAGVNFLDEAPELRNQLLLIEHKIVKHCTEDDAETLAGYLGWHKGKTGYSEFIQGLIE